MAGSTEPDTSEAGVGLSQLRRAETKRRPAAWAQSSYDNAGYNFITNAEGPNAREIAVYGKQPGQTLAAILHTRSGVIGRNAGQNRR